MSGKTGNQPNRPRAVPRSVGHIRIAESLGVGGMGEVYVGWDETLERRVALKAIRSKHRMRPEVKARFLREARILSQLDHPNICRIFDYVEGADRDFLVLEYIEGESLAEAIRDGGLDDSRRLEIAEQVAKALAAAHAKGVVHRDLKPPNVMLSEGGGVKILDFGIARPAQAAATPEGVGEARAEGAATQPPATGIDLAVDARTLYDDAQETELEMPSPLPSSTDFPRGGENRGEETPGTDSDSWTVEGSVLGSPGYLSPEQARGEAATTASDVYAFGLLLQHLFTGEPPHPSGLGVADLIGRARRGEHLPLDGVPSDVKALIGQLLDPAPAARPTAVDALHKIRWIRDKPRRRLIRGAVAAVLLLLVLSGVKYTLDLKAARDVADRHRGQAEDLIGFMLGDLRDKLSDVGRLELLEDVGDKALDYYESLPVEDRTDEELFRRSEALRQIGEVRIAQGDLPAAMGAFEESERLVKALLERDPERGEWLLGLGHSHFWQGNVHWLQGDLSAARKSFQSYHGLTRLLLAEGDPQNRTWRLEEGYAVTNLAAVYEAMGRPGRALAALQRSLDIKEGLLAEDPEDTELQRSLANGLSWQGSMLFTRGDLRGSIHSFQREGRIRRALLAAAPENTDARNLAALNISHTGELALKQGDLNTADQAYREARDHYQSLVHHDPENVDWWSDLAVSYIDLAQQKLAAGDPSSAERDLGEANQILSELVERDDTRHRWQQQVARNQLLTAQVAMARGQASQAHHLLRGARDELAALLRETPGEPALVNAQVEVLLNLGTVLRDQGRPDEARRHWQRAVEIAEPLAIDGQDLDSTSVLARGLLYLGRVEEARPLIRGLFDAGYRPVELERAGDTLGLSPRPSSDAPHGRSAEM